MPLSKSVEKTDKDSIHLVAWFCRISTIPVTSAIIELHSASALGSSGHRPSDRSGAPSSPDLSARTEEVLLLAFGRTDEAERRRCTATHSETWSLLRHPKSISSGHSSRSPGGHPGGNPRSRSRDLLVCRHPVEVLHGGSVHVSSMVLLNQPFWGHLPNTGDSFGLPHWRSNGI